MIFLLYRLERDCVTPTQIVSQMSGKTVVSLGDDLMRTSYLNISDLMDVQEVCLNIDNIVFDVLIFV